MYDNDDEAGAGDEALSKCFCYLSTSMYITMRYDSTATIAYNNATIRMITA